MKFSAAALGFLLWTTTSLDLTNAFVLSHSNKSINVPFLGVSHQYHQKHHNTKAASGALFAAASSDSGDDGRGGGENKKRPLKSRLEGNTREPTAEEVEIMDEMITKLADAPAYELPNAVRRAFRVVSSPRFFLRIAELTDMADDETQKEKLSALAANLVNTLEVVVETTEEQLDERAHDVENVVKAAAEPDSGEFLVPLLPERIAAMRKKLEDLDESSLDEGFLSTIDAWMNKSHQDGMDLMVGILQKTLQMYAGLQIRRARASSHAAEEKGDGDGDDSSEQRPAAKLFDRLLETDTELWDSVIRAAAKDVPPEKLTNEVQRTMESVVLGLENGSMAQQVQAEYLRELATRVETIQKTM